MGNHRFVWLLVLAYFGYLMWPQLRAGLGFGVEPGAAAPAFEAQALDGRTFDMRELQGQVVLVNFWATWCPPCRTEMPGFQQVYRELHGQGFEILAISMDDGAREAVAQFATELELSFPILAGQTRIARAFDGAEAVPTSYLIDRQGRIRRKVVGSFSTQDLRAAVTALLHEQAATPVAAH